MTETCTTSVSEGLTKVGHVFSEEKHKRHGDNTPYKYHNLGTTDAFPDTVCFSGAVVLSYIGGDSGAKRHKYGGDDILDFSCCREAGHVHCAIDIDRALDNDGSDCGNGKLQPHGNPEREQTSEACHGNTEILFFR